jgi:hypothetical protein
MAARRAKNMKRTVVRVSMGVGTRLISEVGAKNVSDSAIDNQEVPNMKMGRKKSVIGKMIR